MVLSDYLVFRLVCAVLGFVHALAAVVFVVDISDGKWERTSWVDKLTVLVGLALYIFGTWFFFALAFGALTVTVAGSGG